MSFCQARATCRQFRVLSPFVAVSPILTVSLSCLLPLAIQLSLLHMTPAVSGLLERTTVPASLDASTVDDAPAVRQPSDRMQKRMERGSSGSRASSVAKESGASSKD